MVSFCFSVVLLGLLRLRLLNIIFSYVLPLDFFYNSEFSSNETEYHKNEIKRFQGPVLMSRGKPLKTIGSLLDSTNQSGPDVTMATTCFLRILCHHKFHDTRPCGECMKISTTIRAVYNNPRPCRTLVYPSRIL